MLHFNKLRLTGFKSFVDPTELVIEAGLTGIVGPNGCGKSNLVEALRWAMGETSAKQVRGGEMDDIIFGGTADRPPRNIAEVLLQLNNHERSAPAQFNDFDELEIGRRIERGSGSTYRVNNREVRARDVQLLFADSATGARSTALVSQGRVGAIIAAKPVERRALLEEAAGITGLHSRRHEAELRLRAAETNLERLDDILVTLEAQLQGLRKQVRQATRYRNLSDHIRRAEATLFLLRWRMAVADDERSRARLREAERLVGEIGGRAAEAARLQAETAMTLPPLRHDEAAVAAELQRLTLARETLDAEAARIADEQREGALRLEHVTADIERERALGADAGAAIRRLDAERDKIEVARAGEAAEMEDARRRLATIAAEVESVETGTAQLAITLAAADARRAALDRRLDELIGRLRRLAAREDELARQRRPLEEASAGTALLATVGEELAASREQLEHARAEADAHEARRAATTAATAATEARLREATAALAGLEAEALALANLLEPAIGELFPPLIDAVAVEPGFEAALGAALGDDLLAPGDEPAPVHWRTLAPLADCPSLPLGAEPLAHFVTAPPALARRLSQVGMVADEATGHRLRDGLHQGQRLVSRDGALWRWDGFTVAAGAATAATARLEQRTRLKQVRAQIGDARAVVEDAERAADEARTRLEDAAATERQAREALRTAEALHGEARDRLTELRHKTAEDASRLAALKEAAEAVAADRGEIEAHLSETRGALAAAADAPRAADELQRRRARLAAGRATQAEAQGTVAALGQEAEARRRRLEETARDLASWQERQAGANARLGQLEERRLAIADDIERLAHRPHEIEGRRMRLQEAIEAAEARRREAADRLAVAEVAVAESNKALRAAEAELADAREEKARAEGVVEQSEQARRGLGERIAEHLQATPDTLPELAGIEPGDEPPDMEATERRVDRLLRERDTMGPVNLRAENEARELDEQIGTLQTERADLIKAIEKLRHGISELNREGRERLLASFSEVDRHFRDLFVRLFGGGRAHLALTESEDPLEAGLEIMASPPGKRLQALSLLSGGEQALTALALLFAVFLTNPAPICVMDEVDAPLDDANVDRFCSLVEEIAHAGRTRFLIITHHRMTMARMDRLFGVTMSERGVSELVSVDLRQAEALRATA